RFLEEWWEKGADVMSSILLEKKNQIAYVTVNREHALNSFDYETLCNLQEVIHHLHFDENTQVVIFTGAGHKAFSAGADLKERKSLTESEVRRNVKAIRDVFNMIVSLPQPAIAAVNCYAFGGGFVLMHAYRCKRARGRVKRDICKTSWARSNGVDGRRRLCRLIRMITEKYVIFKSPKILAREALDLGSVFHFV